MAKKELSQKEMKGVKGGLNAQTRNLASQAAIDKTLAVDSLATQNATISQSGAIPPIKKP